VVGGGTNDGDARGRQLALPIAVVSLVASAAAALAIISSAVSGSGNPTSLLSAAFPGAEAAARGDSADPGKSDEQPGTIGRSNDGGALIALQDGVNALEPRLEAAIRDAGLENSVAIAITDMSTGATAGYRADEMQRSGCVLNFFVLAQALRDVADGRLDINDVEPLVDEIAGFSDAAAAFQLYELVGDGDLFTGLDRVSQLVDETVGPGRAILDHPPGFEWDSLGIDANNYVTAAAMNEGLASLYRGDLLPEPWGSYLLDVMANVDPGLDYLLADLPDGVLVSHKNGWFAYDDGSVENDTAIIRYDLDGIPRAYVITFLSDAPESWNAILLAQSVTRLVYTAFTGVEVDPPGFEYISNMPAEGDAPVEEAPAVEAGADAAPVVATPDSAAETPAASATEPVPATGAADEAPAAVSTIADEPTPDPGSDIETMTAGDEG
jgi:beta-lactamase class A